MASPMPPRAVDRDQQRQNIRVIADEVRTKTVTGVQESATRRRYLVVMTAALRIVAGFLIGYFAVVALTTFGFNVWLGHQPTPEDGALLVAAGTLVAVGSGVAGGAIAALIAGRTAVGIAVAIPLVVESTWLLFLRPRPHPATWDHILGAAILIGSTVGGALIVSRVRRRRAAPERGTPGRS
jgi:hypothetical protein